MVHTNTSANKQTKHMSEALNIVKLSEIKLIDLNYQKLLIYFS